MQVQAESMCTNLLRTYILDTFNASAIAKGDWLVYFLAGHVLKLMI